MGPPGSGKSTLARNIGARLGLPVFHLDQIYWRPGWIEAPAKVFGAEVERISGLPAWVIDGNYTDTIAPRLRAADTIIYLDVPSWLFMPRLAWRILINYGAFEQMPRRDAPSGWISPFCASLGLGTAPGPEPGPSREIPKAQSHPAKQD
jgi:adenylate kinase family enzyme